MEAKHIPFIQWTKKNISEFCINNGYGEPKFSGKEKIMYIRDHTARWARNIMREIAWRRLNYKVEFI
jgi:hypothetical protein